MIIMPLISLMLLNIFWLMRRSIDEIIRCAEVGFDGKHGVERSIRSRTRAPCINWLPHLPSLAAVVHGMSVTSQ